MDWIGAYLRRQRAAFYALFAAGERKAQAPAETDRALPPSGSAASAAASAGHFSRLTGAAAATEAAQTRPGSGGRPTLRSGFPPETAAYSRLSQTGGNKDVSEEGRSLQRDLARHSAARRQAFSRAEDAGSEENQSASPAALREPELRAREISLTVERDARRYDGGFPAF